jgi:hypothetical protein
MTPRIQKGKCRQDGNKGSERILSGYITIALSLFQSLRDLVFMAAILAESELFKLGALNA